MEVHHETKGLLRRVDQPLRYTRCSFDRNVPSGARLGIHEHGGSRGLEADGRLEIITAYQIVLRQTRG